MYDLQFVVRLKCRLLRQRQAWLILFVLFVVVACTRKNELTKNDEIGYASLWQWVDGYVKYNGEFPTKEEFLNSNNMSLRQFFLNNGFSEERVDQFFADSLGDEIDYQKIWPHLCDREYIGRSKSTMIVASNYLMTHPSLQFINQDTCLFIVDSTLFLSDGSVASMNLHLPELLIKDSAYYYNGVRQSSIKSMFQTADSSETVDIFDLSEYSGRCDYEPINVEYDSPVELIDTLCYFFYRLYFINRGVDKDELITVYSHIPPFYRQYVDSILGMPLVFQYSVMETKKDEFEKFKKFYVDLIRNAKIRLHRSNDTVYVNGKPMDETFRLSADSSVIIIDLTHNNTYRDICELLHSLKKATDSESIDVLKEKGFRYRFYFKMDDMLYKALENNFSSCERGSKHTEYMH